MIPAAGLETGDDRLDAMIVLGLGRHVPFRDDPAEVRGGRDLPVDPAAARIAGPEHDRTLPRLAAGDSVGEAAQGGKLRDARHGERAEAERSGLEEQAAVEI